MLNSPGENSVGMQDVKLSQTHFGHGISMKELLVDPLETGLVNGYSSIEFSYNLHHLQ